MLKHTDDIFSRARQIQLSSIVVDTHTDTPQRFLVDHKAASKFQKITEALLRRGYSEPGIRKILGENTLRMTAERERVACALQAGKC